MTETLPPYQPPKAPLTPPPSLPSQANTKMHPVLKGCLIALLILIGLALLAVGACFTFLFVITRQH